MPQFIFENFDRKEFVAKPEIFLYSNAHIEADLSKQTKTNVLSVFSSLVAFISLLLNISGIKECQLFYGTNSNQ